MNVSIVALQLHLQRITKYLQPHLEFVNCHMVGYLTDNLWAKYIPIGIQGECLNETDVDDALQVFWKFQSGDVQSLDNQRGFPALVEFLKETKRYGVTGISVTVEELTKELNKVGGGDKLNDIGGLRIKEFMSEKKMHEVEITSALVANLCTRNDGGGGVENPMCVIDAGDGKGYLSSRLALEYNIRVLGVDANAGNTEGATKRTQKLEVVSTHLLYYLI